MVGEGDTLVLDGTKSSDPDGTSDDARYEWRCFDGDDNPCFESDPSKSGQMRRMLIPSGAKATIDVATKLKTNSK